MKVADYIVERLARATNNAPSFLVSGGMIMHLTDALLQQRRPVVCCHHEAAAVMAADAQGRLRGLPGVAYVTAGPGALNTLTGVAGAFVDSAPVIVVSGQSKVEQARVTGPRQYALQGFNMIPVVERVTKGAYQIRRPEDVEEVIHTAIVESVAGRPGPVWVEVPIDVQAMDMPIPSWETPDVWQSSLDPSDFRYIASAIRKAKRPLILAGAGVRSSGEVHAFQAFCDARGIPVVTSRLGMDLLDHDDVCFVGRPGTYGQRAANFAIQACDLLLVVGCRMSLGLIGHEPAAFAPQAKRIVIECESREMDKPSIRDDDVYYEADLGGFFEGLQRALKRYKAPKEWRAKTNQWKTKYPCKSQSAPVPKGMVDPYEFTRNLSIYAPNDAVVVCDTGSCFHIHAQAWKVKHGQRHIITGGLSTMGYMPAAIGAAGKHPTYCITGDGSIMMHLQELATIRHYDLNVKIIVHSNGGYVLIRRTQDNFCGGRRIGEGPETGVGIPSLRAVAEAFGIPYMRVESIDFVSLIDSDNPGPLLVEVMTPPEHSVEPRVASKSVDGKMVSCAYDDMWPFLDRDEYEEARRV